MRDPQINTSFVWLCSYAEFHLENITLLSLCVVSWCTSHSSGKSKKSKKKKREHDTSKEDENIMEKRGETNQDEAYCISSGDEDYSKGMKSMHESYRVLCFSTSIS